MDRTGSCLCGAARYTLQGDPLATAVCHCTHCQKQSGSAFSVNLIARVDHFHCDGPLAEYADTSDAGTPVGRHFCSKCGSPIYSSLGSSPGLIAVKAGTLDDTTSLDPAVQVWCASRQNWLELSGIPAFERDIPKNAQ